jgi:hypothetical protein
MADTKRPRTNEDILREMEEMSKGIEASDAGPVEQARTSGGALKSLLGFFIKVHGEDEPAGQTPAAAKTPQNVPAKSQPAGGITPGKGATTNVPAAAVTKRIGDLVADEPAPKFNQPKASQAGDLSVKPFEEIYKEAGLAKAGSSVDELVGLMESPTVANHPLAVKVVAVSLALSAKGAKIEDYVTDAVRKDRALDAYQKMLSDRARDVEAKTKSETERIQKEVEEFLKKKQVEIEGLRANATEASRQAIEFSVRRQAEEQRLANAISPFLEGKQNPVTVGNNPEESQPS